MQHFSAETMLAHLPREPVFKLPPPQGLKTVLDAAYFVSLEKEEGRFVRFALVYCESMTSLPAAVQFVNFLPLDPEALRRLASACDPDRTCLVASRDPKQDLIEIVGMAAKPDVSRVFPENRWRRIKIAVIGPAVLELTVGESTVRFERHSYRLIDAYPQLTGLLPDALSNAVARACSTPTDMNYGLRLGNSVVGYKPELLDRHRDALRENARTVAGEVVVRTIMGLIRCLQEAAHGGCLAIVTENLGQLDRLRHEVGGHWFDEWKNGVVLPDPWNCGLLDHVALRTHRALAEQGITVLSDIDSSPRELEKWADSTGRLLVRRAFDLWESDTHASARLANTDGAVLFDDCLRPIAFGCKFPKSGIDAESLPDLEKFVRHRGLRHKSAASFVASTPGLAAIVVSQDGSASLFVNCAGRVRAEAIRI